MFFSENAKEFQNTLHYWELCCTMEIRKRLSDILHMHTTDGSAGRRGQAYGIDERYFGGLRRVCCDCK